MDERIYAEDTDDENTEGSKSKDQSPYDKGKVSNLMKISSYFPSLNWNNQYSLDIFQVFKALRVTQLSYIQFTYVSQIYWTSVNLKLEMNKKLKKLMK